MVDPTEIYSNALEIQKLIDEDIECINRALRLRLVIPCKGLLKSMAHLFPAAIEKQIRWRIKATKLIDWLLLPENRELRRRPSALPYERNTREYHHWRISCLDRDDWSCQGCGVTKNLHIHHIKSYKEHKELRLKLENGLTLCRKCHKNEHKMSKYG